MEYANEPGKVFWCNSFSLINYNKYMPRFIMSLLVCFSLVSCFIPNRVGKVKKITTENISKNDIVFMIPVSYTYKNYLYNSYRRWRPDPDDLAYEKVWDSLQYGILQEYFKVERIDTGPKDSLFRKRPFKFRILLGGTEYARSNLVDYNISQFTWNIRAGKPDTGFNYLPDTLGKLSYQKPVVIFTNDFYFYGANFQAGFAQGGTGIRVLLDFLVVILSQGKVAYYRNFSTSYSFDRLERKPHLKEKIVHKLFDKLE
jgi:hypothetical protein